MKKSTKALLLGLCAVLLVAASVMGTLAYLTSQDTVTNTFTVGKVAITLDEAQVDVYGDAVTPAARVKTNEYKLIPGHTYTKDPTIHVAADSEACYLFVKAENGIAGIEAAAADGYTSIENQILANGWTALEGNADVYYRSQAAAAVETDVAVFGEFAVRGDVDGDALAAYANETVVVTAYAVQAEGFDTAAAAWAASGFSSVQ